MIRLSDYRGALLHATPNVVHVSRHRSFIADLRKYDGESNVLSEIHKVTEHFKNREYSVLKSNYNNHHLTGNLKGYMSLHLFPTINLDIVIVYVSHHHGFHVVLHRIGNHDWVYRSDYKKMDRMRRIVENNC